MKNVDNVVWRETAIDNLEKHGVVDVHHHMIGRAQRKDRNPGLVDWLDMSYLVFCILPSTGPMAKEWSEPGRPHSERIRSLLQFLKIARMTTYYQIARQGILSSFNFDIHDLDESNWQELDNLIRQANERKDWFHEILIKRMNLREGILDKHVGGTLVDAMTTKSTFNWYEYILKVRPGLDDYEVNSKTVIRQLDGQMSRYSIKIDSLLYGYLKCAREELNHLFGGEPHQILTLDDYLGYIDEVFRRISADEENLALKSAIAGVRSLDFPVPGKFRAERVFVSDPDALLPENAVDFENFAMNYICDKAAEHKLPIQIHVAAGPGGYNTYRNCSAGLLMYLVLRHPETRFDLMHGGYPNYGECGALASRFPNVYLNLAWMTMISNAEARQVIDNWLDCIPANKIVWSGDCTYVEETYGVYLVSREQVIDVLGRKIARGHISQDDALFYLRRIFCDNAVEIFDL